MGMGGVAHRHCAGAKAAQHELNRLGVGNRQIWMGNKRTWGTRTGQRVGHNLKTSAELSSFSCY